MKSDNYIVHKARLRQSFDRSLARGMQPMISRYGSDEAGLLVREFRAEYELIIPKIPFIGHRSPFLVFLLPTSRYLSIYRVLQRKGVPVEESGGMMYRMNEAELKSIPVFFRRMVGFLWFSSFFAWRVRKRAEASQARNHPGDYVLTFIEGDGRTFDFGIDYTECAGCKFLDQEGAAELAPFLCALDKNASELLGWGLTRTMTIADGFGKCDFRFRKGGKTDIAISPSVAAACGL